MGGEGGSEEGGSGEGERSKIVESLERELKGWFEKKN